MKIKASKIVGVNLPEEIFLEITENEIKEIEEKNFEETILDAEQIKDIKKNKKKIKEFAAKSLIKKYENPEIVKSILNRDFILMDEPAMAISAALRMEQNIIFCGKGGFGKSEMIKALFSSDLLREKVFIKSLNESTTEEDLFGGVRMKELMDTGAILYKTENSFINHEIVVFEEMFDADISVLSALKDALSSKEIRNGLQREKIKTKIIIGLTNKTPEEVVENNSTEALVQRFPLIQKMEYEITDDVIALMILRSMENPKEISIEDILKKEVLMSGKWKNLTPRKIMQIIKFIDSKIEITGGLTKVAEVSADEIFKTKKTLVENLQHRKREFITKMKTQIEIAKTKDLKTKEQLNEYDSYSKGWK